MLGNTDFPVREKNRSKGVLRSLLIRGLCFIVAVGALVGFVFLFKRGANNKTGSKSKLTDKRQLHFAAEVGVALLQNDKTAAVETGNMKVGQLIESQAPIWAVTDEFNLVDYPIGDSFSSGISIITPNNTETEIINLLMVCGGNYQSGGYSTFCQSLNTTSESLIPQKYAFSKYENGYWRTVVCALSSYSRFILGFNHNPKVARQLMPNTDFYYLSQFSIDSGTGYNNGFFFFANEIDGKEYIETIWTRESPPTVNYARIDPFDDSISSTERINILDAASQRSNIVGAKFRAGIYGVLYCLNVSQDDFYIRFFTKDHDIISTETKISTDVGAYGFQPFLLRLGDYAIAGWGQKQPSPPYPNGFSMRILDFTNGNIISTPVQIFSENQGESSGCAAISIPGGSFLVGCQLPDTNVYLKMFSVVSKQIVYVDNSQLQINQNPVAGGLAFGLLANSQLTTQYKQSVGNKYIVGRIFATKAFAPEWSDPGFKLQVTRGECSDLKYDCSSSTSCVQATLVAGDARTIEAEINGAPHLQFKKDSQAVSTFSIGDEQDNKITVCHDGSAIGTDPAISANVILSWYSTIEGKTVFSDPKLAAMTVTNQAPVIVIPAHALDVEQGGIPLEKELNNFYSDFDGDALAKVEVTDSTGGVPPVWMSVYENNNLWYVKLAPGHGVTTGDKNCILIFTDARGAITSHTTVANVYKPSNAESDSPDGGIKFATLFPVLGAVLSFAFGTCLFTLSVRLCIASGLFGVASSAAKSANDRRRVRKKSKDNHRLVMAILESTGPIEWGFANLDSGVGQTVSNYLEELLDEKYGENFSEKATLANIKKVKQEIGPVIKKIRAKRFSKLYWLIGAGLSSFTCGCVGTGIVVVIQGFDAFLETHDDEIRKGVGLPPRHADVEMQEEGSQLSEPLLTGSEVDDVVDQVVTGRDEEVASVGDDDIGGGLLDDAPTSLGDLKETSDAEILAAGAGFFGGSQDGSIRRGVVLDMSSIAKSSSTESASAPLIRRGSY